MRDLVKSSTHRWLRLGCLMLALGCGDDGPDTGESVDAIEGDGDFELPTGGDGDSVPVGDGDEPGPMEEPGEDAAVVDPGMGDGDDDRPDAGGEMPGPPTAFTRGQAIAAEQKCTKCHQDDYAGLGFFPNLTPHTTGLAKWSDAQIGKAIREGVGNDGKMLCNGMPRFALAEAEMADLIAFLRGLPAVKKEIKSVCPGHGK
jgi:hypothetical protein